MQLYEKYRPKTWDQVIGQDKAVKAIQAMIKSNRIAGQAYWFSGKSGTGKNVCARLLCLEIADDMMIQEYDAGSMTFKDVEEMTMTWSMCGFGKGGRAFIINEAHGLRKDTLRRLLVEIERLPKHVILAFTTTKDGEENLFEENLDSGPLLSRCNVFSLAQRDLAKPFAQRVLEIAQAEGLDGQPLESYLSLANKHKSNFRAMLSAVNSGCMLK